MSRTALALVLVAASASAASAGGFVGLGIGTAPATSGDLSFNNDGRSGRLMLGYRFGRISIDAMGTRYDLIRYDRHPYEATTLALAGRYNFPLGDNFEVFGRAGLARTDLSSDLYNEKYTGNGFLVGGGVEYRVKLGVTGLGVFVDYSIVHNGLWTPRPGDPEVSYTSRTWTLGATLSF